jgi:hypothetical protein
MSDEPIQDAVAAVTEFMVSQYPGWTRKAILAEPQGSRFLELQYNLQQITAGTSDDEWATAILRGARDALAGPFPPTGDDQSGLLAAALNALDAVLAERTTSAFPG